MPQYFAIIGHKDNPIYEAEFSIQQGNQKNLGFSQELKEMNPFILHASLDIIEDLQWQVVPSNSQYTNGNNSDNGSNFSISSTGGFLRSKTVNNTDNCYLGKVDHFYGLAITAYISYGGMKFVMIHGTSNSGGSNTSASVVIDDSACRSFYQEIHELYIKTLMNPFYRAGDPISSPVFDSRVRSLARKYLNK
ncbi:similar to Saccharomyces cerevisiae YBR254C TRS20 One of 10 subunits of the transport protein particle (TRAPP) complex of the cis-Golgi which mediates vesicle docking and fusion [Maudiozyma barnettii]|uniref:Similar to Saccharomyces cerevisiae YBR254C TRS20 One of 10 subunits of the transport protein particle (TRAPP) complex of the cis-Golgi which mediates vesicle docking and fusion n=1 Tax=Maudiozyma barnettii TaxID=61262 RepID=A0A8H2ZH05_9SACH|nr:TRAPP subunit TRS20 [Kazachstania barnettii]CAB4254057.1 similar to Saccharomyces cerevisiae YBR254C TRS20 One of 10 subunits of the transport protein particle (TRAPP) complex of the cis-Golgi which mediates vesicle docking and fusion [Kazachstania barnettii]CAD1781807.1 similar to Saccharomyces cerevisiae YBR254C TRS20 One of 10 subunits of the transport protein particle (TRAPP) complex of the cis-Golgi which mediates vesicle docking and fusion [Kazachstania barnettii]